MTLATWRPVRCILGAMFGRRLFPWVLGIVFTLAAREPPPGGPETDTPAWQTLFHGLAPALLGVWGSGADDVFVVGSDPGDGAGPWVLHWDGVAWERLRTGASGALWSVAGTDRSRPVFMVGAGGLALRWDRGVGGASGQFTRLTGVANDVTLAGVVAVGSDVWAVGGGGDGRGRAYVLGGDAWTPLGDVPAAATNAGVFSGVWGRAPDDLWIVGQGGKVLHKHANDWQTFAAPAGQRLGTVHGNGVIAVAVGGLVSGVVGELAEAGVTDATPLGMPPMDGVWVRPDGTVLAVGDQGAVWERTGNHWQSDVDAPSSILSYHAVYIDPAGGAWIAGGNVQAPQREGLLLHFGVALPSGAMSLPE